MTTFLPFLFIGIVIYFVLKSKKRVKPEEDEKSNFVRSKSCGTIDTVNDPSYSFNPGNIYYKD